MRHPDDHLFQPLGRADFDQGVEQGHERLAAFNGKALLANMAGMQKALKFLRRHQALEDLPLSRVRKRGLVEARFHALLQPGALILVGNAFALHPQSPGIGSVQLLDEVAQGPVGLSQKTTATQRLVEIVL